LQTDKVTKPEGKEVQDFMELALRRQSCRDFSDKPVEHEKLVRCVEAALLAPSGCNSQPWSFVVVEDPEKVKAIAPLTQALGNAFVSKAQAFIIVLEEHAVLNPKLRTMLDSQYFAKGDLGAAVLSVCLEATSLGLGTCILGVYDREKICEVTGIPAEKSFGGLIAAGYPANDNIRAKTRKTLEESVRFISA
jgi:nitroreductase